MTNIVNTTHELMIKLFGGIYAEGDSSSIISLAAKSIGSYVPTILYAILGLMIAGSIYRISRTGSWQDESMNEGIAYLKLLVILFFIMPNPSSGLMNCHHKVIEIAEWGSELASKVTGDIIEKTGYFTNQYHYENKSAIVNRWVGKQSSLLLNIFKQYYQYDQDILKGNASIGFDNVKQDKLQQAIIRKAGGEAFYNDMLDMYTYQPAKKTTISVENSETKLSVVEEQYDELSRELIRKHKKQSMDLLLGKFLEKARHSNESKRSSINYSLLRLLMAQESINKEVAGVVVKEVDEAFKALEKNKKQNLSKVFGNLMKQQGWLALGNAYNYFISATSNIQSQLSDELNEKEQANGLGDTRNLTRVDNEYALETLETTKFTDKKLISTSYFDVFSGGLTQDPLLSLTSLGNRFILGGEMLTSLGAVGMLTEKVSDLCSVIKICPAQLSTTVAFLSKGTGWSTSVGLYLLLLGCALVVVPKALIWICFMMSVFAWISRVVELFLIAPLWLTVNGFTYQGEVINNLTKKGFYNIVYVALFPLFVSVSFIASLTLLWVAFWLLNLYFVPFYASLGFIPGLFSLWLYAMLALLLLMKVFELVITMPNTMINWLCEEGFSGNNVAEKMSDSFGLKLSGQSIAFRKFNAKPFPSKFGSRQNNQLNISKAKSVMNRFDSSK